MVRNPQNTTREIGLGLSNAGFAIGPLYGVDVMLQAISSHPAEGRSPPFPS
jgi:hypothetical protein